MLNDIMQKNEKTLVTNYTSIALILENTIQIVV